jgi:molybdopterin-biosynthesis enzyme MoeA-like protein
MPCQPAGVKLALHQPTVDLMQQHYSARGLELNEARLRMATLPTPAEEVLVTPGTWVPLVVVQGVHILPGIPKLFQSMITAHQVRVAAACSCVTKATRCDTGASVLCATSDVHAAAVLPM